MKGPASTPQVSTEPYTQERDGKTMLQQTAQATQPGQPGSAYGPEL